MKKIKYKVTGWYVDPINREVLNPLQTEFEANMIECIQDKNAIEELGELKILNESSKLEHGARIIDNITIWYKNPFNYWIPIRK